MLRAIRGLYEAAASGHQGWLASATRALLPQMDEGLGLLTFTHRTAGPPELWAIADLTIAGECEPGIVPSMRAAFDAAPAEFRTLVFGAPGATFSERMGDLFVRLPPEIRILGRAFDMVLLTTRDPDGSGVSVTAPLASPKRLPSSERKRIETIVCTRRSEPSVGAFDHCRRLGSGGFRC